MITLICSILVGLGIANWFCIGALQYDFVAGLFGSQANIFSRIVYVCIGLAGIVLIYSIIRNKGKVAFKNKDKPLFNFHKKNKEQKNENNDTPNHDLDTYQNEQINKSIEASNDTAILQDEENTRRNQEDIEKHRKMNNPNSRTFFANRQDTEASSDQSQDANTAIQSRANRINANHQLSEKNFHDSNDEK